jgi:hypothetical protein
MGRTLGLDDFRYRQKQPSTLLGCENNFMTVEINEELNMHHLAERRGRGRYAPIAVPWIGF